MSSALAGSASSAAQQQARAEAEKLAAARSRAQAQQLAAARAKAARAAKAKAAKARADQAAKAAQAAKAERAAKAKRAADAKAAAVSAAQLAATRNREARVKEARDRAAEAAKAALLRFDPLNGGIRSTNPVVAVKIDNTSAGRPQYGLADADVVYVEQVEGGLTRLIGVFHSVLPAEVGPVRSVRSTDVDLLQSYGRPLLAFSGGAGGPLAMLASSPLMDASGGPGYWRSHAKHAPYNLHVDVKRLVGGIVGKQPARSPGFTFGTAYPAARNAPRRTDISVTMEAGHTGFRYDASAGNYRVNHSGIPSTDAAGRPLVTKNVLVQRVVDLPDGTVDTNGQPSLLSRTTGKGNFSLFRNGREITGRWFRFQVDGPTKFLDAAGKPVLFDRGRTWVMLAPQTARISAS